MLTIAVTPIASGTKAIVNVSGNGKAVSARASGEAQQHGEEGEQADQGEQDADRENRRVHSLPGHSGDRRKGSAPQVTNRPPVLPNRHDERQNSASNERETQIHRRLWKVGGVRFGRLLQAFEELMAKPKPISAVAVRSHDIIVRSRLRRVRIQPKWLSAVALTSNLPALGVGKSVTLGPFCWCMFRSS
jgi:hypothetical protein